MCIGAFGWKLKTQVSGVLGVIFFVLSVPLANVDSGWISFALGVIACVAVIGVVKGWRTENSIWLSKYTMPIFVMHTLSAAPLRAVLLKVGVNNAVVHVILGIAISFIGPIIAAEIMKKTTCLEFFLYPGKFARMG